MRHLALHLSYYIVGEDIPPEKGGEVLTDDRIRELLPEIHKSLEHWGSFSRAGVPFARLSDHDGTARTVEPGEMSRTAPGTPKTWSRMTADERMEIRDRNMENLRRKVAELESMLHGSNELIHREEFEKWVVKVLGILDRRSMER